MRLGITAKLFLALLSLGIVAVLAMSVASRISFTRGFLGYLNEQGIERAEALLPVVASAYETHGSWDFLRGRPRGWFEILRRSAGVDGTAVEESSFRAPPDAARMGLDLRIGLLDADGVFVAGNPDIGPDSERRAVRVGGQVVGWLAVVPFERIGAGAELRFQRRQLRMTWLIGIASVLLAAAVAVWLARRMLAGVKQITHSVSRLGAGDYAARVPAVSRDELGSLAMNINQLAQALQRTEQTRREFMADVSHELRTPLAVLRAELEAIEDGVRQPTIESVRSLQAEVTRLGKLVDDLYTLSLSDAGALTYRMEAIDVCEPLQAVLEGLRPSLAEQAIRVEAIAPEDGLRIRGDMDRLRQLFGNIIENSIRYTDRGGMLRVSCSRDRASAVIDFQDTAPGVPEVLLPRLFERFYRSEASRNRASGGAGLGLAISRNIAEAHGGSIAARQSDLGGLHITVVLPLDRG